MACRAPHTIYYDNKYKKYGDKTVQTEKICFDRKFLVEEFRIIERGKLENRNHKRFKQ